MAISRFENYDPALYQPQPMEYVSKIPGELLLKAGAIQQEKFDKVGKGIEDVGDLLNIKVDPKDLPNLKKRQAYYNDKLATVAQDMAEGKSTTSKAAIDLLSIKKEMVKDDFLNYAPVNYENKLKAEKRKQELEATGKVSEHNKVFDKDYANWPGTLDPNTNQVNMFSSVGAYIDKDYRKDLEEVVDNVKMDEFGTVTPLADGTMKTEKRGNITRQELINVMQPALQDFMNKNAGEIGRRKDFYGQDDLGTLELTPVIVKNKANKDVVKGYDWKNKGLLASVIDERVVQVSDVGLTIRPGWTPPTPKEEEGDSPVTFGPTQTAYIYNTVKDYEGYKNRKTELYTELNNAKASGDKKKMQIASNKIASLDATENKFFQEWLSANPEYKETYDKNQAILYSSDPETSKEKIVYIGGIPYKTTLKEQAKKEIENLKNTAFKENSVFDQYLKNNNRSETPTLVSLPGLFATKGSATPGEIKGVKYEVTNDILTKEFRNNPDNFEITKLDGSAATVDASDLALTYMQRTPDSNGKLVLTANEVDDEGKITGTQFRVSPKNDTTENSVKNILKKGYYDTLGKEKDKYGNVVKFKEDATLQAYLDIVGFDMYKDLVANREPNSTNYTGTTTLTIDEGPNKGKKIDVLVVSDNANEEFSGNKADYVINYTTPDGNDRSQSFDGVTLKDISDELTKIMIALRRSK